MVTGAEPLEVKVIDFVTAVPTETLPNASDVALALSAGVDGEDEAAELFRLIDVDFDVVPCVAVNVAVCDDVTTDTFAVKRAFFAPEATVTEAGTETAPLLLAMSTTIPLPGAAPFSVTVQVSAPAPIIEEFVQLRPDNEGVDCDPLP
jgi:hypothetical protein